MTTKSKKVGRGRPRKFDGAQKAVNFRLPMSVWKGIKERADKKDLPVSDLIRDALCEWLLAASVNRPITSRVAK